MSFLSSETNTSGGEMMSAALFESAPANEGDRIHVASSRSNGDVSSIATTRYVLSVE